MIQLAENKSVTAEYLGLPGRKITPQIVIFLSRILISGCKAAVTLGNQDHDKVLRIHQLDIVAFNTANVEGRTAYLPLDIL